MRNRAFHFTLGRAWPLGAFGALVLLGAALLIWRADRRSTAVPPEPGFAFSALRPTVAPRLSDSESPIASPVLLAASPTFPPPPTAVPSPAATTRPAPDDEALRAIVGKMSPEEKIGQMMIAGFDGQTLEGSADLSTLLSAYHVGGLVLLERNAHDPAQVAALVRDAQAFALQNGSHAALFVAINHEGGHVVRITEGVTGYPGNMAIAATGQPAYAYAAAAMAAAELRAMGINVNLAPVLDVSDVPLNPIIGARSFGESPQEVARLGSETIRGYQENGVLAVAKHFPGHGSTEIDSHVGLPVIDKPASELEQVELVPFQAAVEEGVAAIMTAHVVVPAWEPGSQLPASLSPSIVTGILRERMGYEGLVMSDSLGMGAIAGVWGQGQAAVEAVRAGSDIVLSTGPLRAHAEIHQALVAAVRGGELTQERIDESILRILRAKHMYGIADDRSDVDLGVVGSAAHQAAADEMALAAITLHVDGAGLVPLPKDVRRLLVLSPKDLPPAPAGQGTLLAEQLRERGFEVTELIYDLDRAASRQVTYAQALRAAPGHDAILYGEWEMVKRAVNHSDRWQESLVAGLQSSGTPLLMISWHHPEAILYVSQVPSYLIAYGSTPAQVKGVAQVLTGEAAPRGKLPLTLRIP